MAASAEGSRRSRLRLVVVQALVFSLFATLLGRLYYLQVVTGDEYTAKAASQSVREVVVQPQRGLIVDAQGRPLVTNRTSWVVSVDRTVLGRMGEERRTQLLKRLAHVVGVGKGRIERALVTCGDDGSVAGECWNGSPYQAVPVATDVPQDVALRVLEQPEDFPAVLAEQQTVRAYPKPFGVNLAHVLGYLSPITEEEYDAAQADEDTSLNGASTVGRAGVEQQYDAWLRGMPGYQRVAVDSMGRVLGDDGEVEAVPGSTLVTSIDAKVQGVVEQQLAATIARQRATYDPVTKRNYEADSGAAVVLEAKTGRVVAMASQPTYDPEAWVGGISKKELARLYSEDAGTPLLGRATQGQFAPGSTWKPFMTAGALTHGYSTDTRLACSSSFRVGNRDFHNHESAAYGSIGFDRALEVSCNTFFFRVGYDFWQRLGSDVDDVDAKDPLVDEAKTFGFGSETGVDLPGEASGRIADRKWKRAYYEQMKDYYCGISEKPQDGKTSDFVYKFAREFCVEGYAYRAGDAVNFAIGQGDTIVTPLQLARAYGAIANGGTLYEPRIAKAVVGPDGEVVREIKPTKAGSVGLPKKVLSYLDTALKGVSTRGTMNWKLAGFPLDQVQIRSKTGSAEVYGKQSTGWVASYTDDYVVVMMVSQAGTGSGSNGEAVRAIYEALYGVTGEKVDPKKTAIPGTVAPATLPTFTDDGAILPPARKKKGTK
ncbi:penicillin-binding protein 2 [Nocardioides lianchengensis]|uniref:Penicillin-binding protein 2 n=1 Tax=Nocardioides lianchengensis TaxID=1045774 RepID=A0A1G6NXQ7_9ACTN|nr:penicillin-binding protein 2 [Nocardioides lianchengensis]NYG10913.1 penicillin-binding protein 2 [Nocardioides lianchengensis]SDC72124.1 penicillin-binding protein 2 [Nocardioides lianchengensis]